MVPVAPPDSKTTTAVSWMVPPTAAAGVARVLKTVGACVITLVSPGALQGEIALLLLRSPEYDTTQRYVPGAVRVMMSDSYQLLPPATVRVPAAIAAPAQRVSSGP